MNNFLPLLCALSGAAATTWLVTPLVAKLAVRLGVVDHPGGRRIHGRPTPRLGGVAVVIGLLVGASVYGVGFGIEALLGVLLRGELLSFLLPCVLVFLVGLVDDLRGLSPGPRIAVEAIAAGFLIHAGYVIDNIANPFGAPIELGMFAYPLTIAWLVGVTNAFNLVDGLDGLLGSVSLTALVGCATVALLGERFASATLALAMAGSVLGFLYWNWSPARVFMGDSGSLLVGFAIAGLSLKIAKNPSGTLAVHVPLLLCGLPIGETLLTLARRHVSGKPYLSGDRSHIHHVLVNKGLSTPRAVIALTVVSALLAFSAVLSRAWRDQMFLTACVFLFALAVVALRWLGYLEMKVLADRLVDAVRRPRRRQLADSLRLAAAGEAIALSRSLPQLTDAMKGFAGECPIIRFKLTLSNRFSSLMPLAEGPAAGSPFGPPAEIVWSYPGALNSDERAGSVLVQLPLADPYTMESLGSAIIERPLGPTGPQDADLVRYIANPLVTALCSILKQASPALSA